MFSTAAKISSSNIWRLLVRQRVHFNACCWNVHTYSRQMCLSCMIRSWSLMNGIGWTGASSRQGLVAGGAFQKQSPRPLLFIDYSFTISSLFPASQVKKAMTLFFFVLILLIPPLSNCQSVSPIYQLCVIAIWLRNRSQINFEGILHWEQDIEYHLKVKYFWRLVRWWYSIF